MSNILSPRSGEIPLVRDGIVAQLANVSAGYKGHHAINLDQLNSIVSSIVGVLSFQGGYDASTNTPDLDIAPVGVLKGYTWVVTVAGVFFSEAVDPGDLLISKINNPTLLTDWVRIQRNIPENFYSVVEDEGTPITQRSTLNFVGAGISASDVGGKSQISLNTTLNALAGYNTNGLITQTAADTFTGRTIIGTTNRISVSNGDGVAANPTIDISTSYIGQASITTLGTITTGVWNGTEISEVYGGTNQSAYVTGDVLYASAANTLSRLAIGSAGQVLTVVGGIPAWQTLGSIAGIVTGTGTTNVGVKWTDGAASEIGDGTWEYSGNTWRPITTGSDLGDSTHRIATLYMASAIDYSANLTWVTSASTKMTLTTAGFLGINASSPTSLLEIRDTTGQMVRMSNANVAHGMTGLVPTDVFMQMGNISSTAGGIAFTGLSDTDAIAMRLSAISGSTTPSVTVMSFRSSKKSGASSTSLSDSQIAFQWENFTAVKATMLGDGSLRIGDSSSPTARLYVHGGGTSSATHSLIIEDSASTIALSVRDDRRVGVRTSSPRAALDVVRASSGGSPIFSEAIQPMIIENDAGAYLSFAVPNGTFSGIIMGDVANNSAAELNYSHATDAWQFNIQNKEVSLIWNTGKMKVGYDIDVSIAPNATYEAQLDDGYGFILNNTTAVTDNSFTNSPKSALWARYDSDAGAGIIESVFESYQQLVMTAAGASPAGYLKWNFAGTDRLFLTSAGNLGIGTSSFGASGVNVFGIKNGTAPGLLADVAQLYSDDWNGAGTATLRIINEEGHTFTMKKSAAYTPTNVTTDRSFNANSTTLDEIADVVGTIIADLQGNGFLG